MLSKTPKKIHKFSVGDIVRPLPGSDLYDGGWGIDHYEWSGEVMEIVDRYGYEEYRVVPIGIPWKKSISGESPYFFEEELELDVFLNEVRHAKK